MSYSSYPWPICYKMGKPFFPTRICQKMSNSSYLCPLCYKMGKPLFKKAKIVLSTKIDVLSSEMIIKHFWASEIIQILTNDSKTPGKSEKPTSKQWKNSCRWKIKPLRFVILNKLTKIYSNNFSVKIRCGIFKTYQGKNILLSQIREIISYY